MNRYVKYVKNMAIGAALGLISLTNCHNYREAMNYLDISGVPTESRHSARSHKGNIMRKEMEETNPLFRPGYAIALMRNGHYVEFWDIVE